MLKFFFWVLLLANGALLAYQQGYLESLVPSGREPARLTNQLNADKVKLIPPPAPILAAPSPAVAADASASSDNQNTAATPAAASVSATPSAPAVMPTAKAPQQTAQKTDAAACTEVGNFNRQEATQFESRLSTLALGVKVTRRPIREVASHIVYIPPLPDLESAEKKAGELRRLGITDYYIMQDNSPLRMGISLGVFKQEEAAREHLARLNQRGVRSARIGERSVTTNMTAFQVRDLNPAGREAISKVVANFPRSQIRACESN